jgi:hypothetical protein
LVCRKHEKIEKVTASQDDGFVGGLETQLVGMQKHEKIEKVTASQDDGFVGGLETQLVGMQKTRKDRKSHSLSSGCQRGEWCFGLNCLMGKNRKAWVNVRSLLQR